MMATLIKKLSALIIILSLLLPCKAYALEDLSSNSEPTSEEAVSNEEIEIVENSESHINDITNHEETIINDSIDETEQNVTNTIQAISTPYSNEVISIETTNVIMEANSTKTIPYVILNTDYTVTFWYEGNRRFTKEDTGTALIITSQEAEVNCLMVHYANSSTNDEGHFYINITVYPSAGYVNIDNLASGRCLDVRGSYTNSGTKTIIFAKYSQIRPNQVWKIVPQSSGSVALQSVLRPDRFLYINPSTLNAEINTNKTFFFFNYIGSSGHYTITAANNINGTTPFLGVEGDAIAADSEVIAATSGLTNSKKWGLTYIADYVPTVNVVINSPSSVDFTEKLSTSTITFSAVSLPSNATNPAITWFSSNASIATIDPLTGEAQLKSTGLVQFFAKANDGTVTDSIRVNVISDFYYIKNSHSGRYFDIANNGIANNTHLLHWSFHGSYNQIMKIEKRGLNTFSIHPVPSMNSRALTVSNNGIILSDYTGNDNQLFKFNYKNHSLTQCTIRSCYNNYALTPDASNNKYIISEPYSSNNTLQEWTFVKYEDKAMSMLNFGAYSLYPDANYEFLAYNTLISSLPEFNLGNQHYMQGACWKAIVPSINGVPSVTKQDLLALMPYSDIVYIDSHASSSGIYLSDGTNENKYISFDDIGITYTNSSRTKTNSIFNKKTKWIISSACSQLDLSGSCGQTNSALSWIKAMLGDGERLHGVLGYYGSAPGDETFNNVLQGLLNDQATTNNTIVTSWCEANHYDIALGLITRQYNWASLYYEDNEGDRLTNFTQTTPSGSSGRIIHMYADHGDTTTANISVSSSMQSNDKSPTNVLDILRTSTNDSTSTLTNDTSTISMCSDGSVFYKNNSISLDTNSHISDSMQEAAQFSLNYIAQNGIIPSSNYTAHITPITKCEFNLSTQTFCDETVVGYQITFILKNYTPAADSKEETYTCIKSLYTSSGVASFKCYTSILPISKGEVE